MTLKNFTIVGYSGHSYLCIEASVSLNLEILGYYDVVERLINPYKLEFLGNEDQIKIDHQPFISIGNNSIREKVYNKLLLNKICLERSILHPSAIISNTSLIEKQTFVSAGVIINPQVKIGVGCIINTGAIIEHDCSIDKFSHIAPGAVLLGNVSIGSGCMIGANAVIKQGVSIGDDVTIGAGAVVLKDINSNTTFVGNPAIEIKRI